MGAGVEEQGRYARRAREERLRRDERTTGMSAEANDGSAGDTHARGSKRGSTDLWTETKEEGQTKERGRGCKAYITEQEHGRSVPLSSLLGLPLFLDPSFLSVRSPLQLARPPRPASCPRRAQTRARPRRLPRRRRSAQLAQPDPNHTAPAARAAIPSRWQASTSPPPYYTPALLPALLGALRVASQRGTRKSPRAPLLFS